MGADMLTATIAEPVARAEPLDFVRGRDLLRHLTGVDPHEWDFDLLADAVLQFDDLDSEVDTWPPPVEVVIQVGLQVIDNLAEALDSRRTTTLEVAGYRLHISGGLSSGDSPTDEADAIWNAYCLPDRVLQAIGFVPDFTKPLSRKNGNPGPVTDTDVVDALALGLGTRPEWKGGDELEWIADTLGQVRVHPGGQDPREYVANFAAENDFDPANETYLAGYIDDFDADEDTYLAS